MNKQPLEALNLPPIDQVGYVVRDLDKALQQYEKLFGPFKIMDSPLSGAIYRGKPCDVHLRIAFGKDENLEIEFIEVLSGESPHSEFLAQGREGIHHIRYRVADVDAIIEQLHELDFETVWYHDIGFAKWAYCQDRNHSGVMLEFLQMSAEQG